MLLFSAIAISSKFGSLFPSSNKLNCSVKSREGTSSSTSSNHYVSQKKKEKPGERDMILNSQIEGIILGIEPIGSLAMHKIVNNKYIGTIRKLTLPTYLGGGNFCYHLSCLIKIRGQGLFGFEKNNIILEFGGYFGDEPDYKNYVHYWQEDGLRFSKMTEEDYRAKITEAGSIGEMIEVILENKMTVRNLITECCKGGKWRAYDYNLSSNNCQDFIAKVIEVLCVKRKDSDIDKFTKIPPCIMRALEKNEGSQLLRFLKKIPIIGNSI